MVGNGALSNTKVHCFLLPTNLCRPTWSSSTTASTWNWKIPAKRSWPSTRECSIMITPRKTSSTRISSSIGARRWVQPNEKRSKIWRNVISLKWPRTSKNKPNNAKRWAKKRRRRSRTRMRRFAKNTDSACGTNIGNPWETTRSNLPDSFGDAENIRRWAVWRNASDPKTWSSTSDEKHKYPNHPKDTIGKKSDMTTKSPG